MSTSAATADEESDPAVSAPDHASGSSGEAQSRLSRDVIFGLLSVERRRYVLNYLADNGGQTTLSDLADHIAARENDTEIRLLGSQQRKRVYVGLYQCHLPKLDDADVIDFDQSRGTVERRPNADLLYAYLAVDPRPATEDDSPESAERTTLRERLATFLPRRPER